MVFIYILLSILIFIVLLLCIKLTFITKYEDVFELEARWLFIRYKLYPPKEKKDEKKRKMLRKSLKKTANLKKRKNQTLLKSFMKTKV